MRRMFPSEGFHRAKTSTMYGHTITADGDDGGECVFINDEKTFAFGYRLIKVKGSSKNFIIDGVEFPTVEFIRNDDTISSTPGSGEGNFFLATVIDI